ncbi:MAG: SOS response-associated peptidase [Planctomycetota bacterium]|jgi:putative SOS response-associated peptidase YedK
MCGRFALNEIPRELFEEFGIECPDELPFSYNICPSQRVLALLSDEESRSPLFLPLQWGLIPFWSKDKDNSHKMINARSETVDQKPSFRAAVRHRRCLIPASGFYEWQKTAHKIKQPYYITMQDMSPLVMAGIWELWEGPGEEFIYSCAILTTAANEKMKKIHDRMPVILKRENWKPWLDSSIQHYRDIEHFFDSSGFGTLNYKRVSKAVNDTHNNSPECIREDLTPYDSGAGPLRLE